MPNYDYECSKCGQSFEAFQSMKDQAFKTCPEEKCCMEAWGRGDVKRMIGAGAGLIFKGSGFYITDYRSEGYKSAAKSDAGGSSAPSSQGNSSTPAASPPPSSSAKSEGSSGSSSSTDKKPPTKKD